MDGTTWEIIIIIKYYYDYRNNNDDDNISNNNTNGDNNNNDNNPGWAPLRRNMVRSFRNSSDRGRAGKKARGKPAQLQARQSQEARHGTARQEGRQTTTSIPFPFTKFQCAFQKSFIKIIDFFRISLDFRWNILTTQISLEFHQNFIGF